jgi:L-amino acid N-acyltransferase YncA
MIRPVVADDAAVLAQIYNHYILNTHVTFEEEPVETSEMAARISTSNDGVPWLVYEAEGAVVGYAYASKWKSRCAYRYSAETTIYLRGDATGRGIGRQLYARLLEILNDSGLHSIIGGIALPNAASQRLHESLGFRKVAHFEQVGWKFNKWIDVGYWELIFPSTK